jgi:hypothetical protein
MRSDVQKRRLSQFANSASKVHLARIKSASPALVCSWMSCRTQRACRLGQLPQNAYGGSLAGCRPAPDLGAAAVRVLSLGRAWICFRIGGGYRGSLAYL